jgi:hypothetical protein
MVHVFVDFEEIDETIYKRVLCLYDGREPFLERDRCRKKYPPPCPYRLA